MGGIFQVDKELMLKGLEEALKHQLNLLAQATNEKIKRMELATSLDDERSIMLETGDNCDIQEDRYQILEKLYEEIGGNPTLYAVKYIAIQEPLQERMKRIIQAFDERRRALT